jgi:replicative superfamily II helicase
VLDVLQIFGRAGRPGLEADGEGYLLTSEDNLTHYLDAVTAQVRKLYLLQAKLMRCLTLAPDRVKVGSCYAIDAILSLN